MPNRPHRSAVKRQIEFLSDSTVIRGWLRVPDVAGPHPLVILAHGLGGLKEYGNLPEVAEAIVAAGIAAMAFDYRNFGESDGLPREDVNHGGQIEDWQSAISFATTRTDVDAERIGIWGTSLGGRNVLAVAALDRRINCVLAQVPLIKLPPEFGAYVSNGGDLDEFYRVIAKDRHDRALGKEPRYVYADPNASPEEGGDMVARLGADLAGSYRHTHRALEPNVANDITHLMELIAPTPLMMIVADGDVLPGQLEAFKNAHEPKSLVLVHGHHYSCYSTNLDRAVSAARDWFTDHLRAAPPESAALLASSGSRSDLG